jgi:LytS/YehU family sensor histidine kinase
VISGLAIFYFQIFFLIPNYLLNKKPGIYALGCLALLIGTLILIYLINIVELYLSMSGMGIRLTFLRFFSMPEPILLLTAAALQIIIVPALIYAFIKDLLKQKTIGFKLFRNKEAELQQLRSQVNPHFLFNSLNTLYAFALKENNTKTAEYIAKLANLMRYLVDDMEKAKIPVQKEISYIRDYINLQAIRSSVEHNIDINIAIDEDQNIMIAPMLMIPFVENAFKHGINPNSVSELKVTVQITDHQFQFVIENSVDRNFEAFYKEKGFGIGIANVRQRLEHIYPGKHTLSVADTADRFIVIMTIALMEMGEITI